MDNREQEVAEKLALMRDVLHRAPAAAIRLRGTDWFAWATAGASNALQLSRETGVAEVLITRLEAVILTDTEHAQRLESEELPVGFRIYANRWMDTAARNEFVQRKTAGRAVLSDRPAAAERPLPEELLRRRLVLGPGEQARYRVVCRLASEAVAEVLQAARPDWSECQLAGAAAAALWARQLQPVLTLAASQQRMALYRQPPPTRERLQDGAVLVVAARGAGLYANLTRSITFSPLSEAQTSRQRQLQRLTQAALAIARPGASLEALYRTLAAGYAEAGCPQAIHEHPQGSLTGYLANEGSLIPSASLPLRAGMALTLHPALPGLQSGDTYLVRDAALPENLTAPDDRPAGDPTGMAGPLSLAQA
jgi:Xaa-Pro aminopeptidase